MECVDQYASFPCYGMVAIPPQVLWSFNLGWTSTSADGDSTGSFATLNPGLYAYKAISLNNLKPDGTWDKYIVDLIQDSLEYYLDFEQTILWQKVCLKAHVQLKLLLNHISSQLKEIDKN